MQINSIMKKVKDFIETPKGREKIREARIDAFTKGKKFGSGVGITSPNDYVEVAKKYFGTLETTVNSNRRSSDSLKAIIGGLKNTSTILNPAKVSRTRIGVEIEFDKKSLARESVDYDHNRSSIDNIVALFNNGFDVPEGNTPYGDWIHDGTNYHIKGWTHRDALKFMQTASRNFKAENREKYKLYKIELDKKYDE